MVPSDQRLEADRLDLVQFDDRLVEQLECAVLDGLVEFGADLHPLEYRGVQGRLVTAPLALAAALGDVEREIRLAEQFLRVAGLGGGGHPDAGHAADERLADEERLGECRDDLLGDALDLLRAGDVLDQRGELVTAEPGDACPAVAVPRRVA